MEEIINVGFMVSGGESLVIMAGEQSGSSRHGPGIVGVSFHLKR